MKPIKVIGALILACIAVEFVVIGMLVHDYLTKPSTMTPVVVAQVQEHAERTKRPIIYMSLPYQQWIMRTQVQCLQSQSTMKKAHECMLKGGIVI